MRLNSNQLLRLRAKSPKEGCFEQVKEAIFNMKGDEWVYYAFLQTLLGDHLANHP